MHVSVTNKFKLNYFIRCQRRVKRPLVNTSISILILNSTIAKKTEDKKKEKKDSKSGTPRKEGKEKSVKGDDRKSTKSKSRKESPAGTIQINLKLTQNIASQRELDTQHDVLSK